MARKASPERIQAAAWQGGREMIARGQRPKYWLRSVDGGWQLYALPWLAVKATGRREALDEARAAIAAWLEVDAEVFDVETG